MIFRDKLESKKGIILGGGCCVVCGWDKKNFKGESLVEGAHVRPYLNIPDYDKSDNIVGLCPNHHTEYDAGNLAIDPIRKICICTNQKDPFHLKSIIGKVSHIKQGYFDYHRQHVFKSKYSV